MKSSPKRIKPTDWVSRLPAIKDMMRFMTDNQIAEQYNVSTKTIKDLRRKHRLPRSEDKNKTPADRMPKQLVGNIAWDFTGMDLN